MYFFFIRFFFAKQKPARAGLLAQIRSGVQLSRVDVEKLKKQRNTVFKEKAMKQNEIETVQTDNRIESKLLDNHV